MNSHFFFNLLTRRPAHRGQGLTEYAILLAVVGVLLIAVLLIWGGSIEGGLLKLCAELGNEDCQVAATGTIPAGSPTPTNVVEASTAIPTATQVSVDPDPTRVPVSTIVAPEPTEEPDLVTLRIKVVVTGKGGNPGGIRVVVYNASGGFAGEGVTDSKGNVSFQVPAGSYTVATYYNNIRQVDGPFSLKKSKQFVIRR